MTGPRTLPARASGTFKIGGDRPVTRPGYGTLQLRDTEVQLSDTEFGELSALAAS